MKTLPFTFGQFVIGLVGSLIILGYISSIIWMLDKEWNINGWLLFFAVSIMAFWYIFGLHVYGYIRIPLKFKESSIT